MTLPLPDGLCPGRAPGPAHPAAEPRAWADAVLVRELARVAAHPARYADLRDGALVRPARLTWAAVARRSLAGALVLGLALAGVEAARWAEAVAQGEAGAGHE